MAAMAHLALDRATGPRLVVLELAAKVGDLALAQRVDREMVAAFAIAFDIALAQQFRHANPPVFFFSLRQQRCFIKTEPAIIPLSRSAVGAAPSRFHLGSSTWV